MGRSRFWRLNVAMRYVAVADHPLCKSDSVVGWRRPLLRCGGPGRAGVGAARAAANVPSHVRHEG